VRGGGRTQKKARFFVAPPFEKRGMTVVSQHDQKVKSGKGGRLKRKTHEVLSLKKTKKKNKNLRRKQKERYQKGRGLLKREKARKCFQAIAMMEGQNS